MKTVPYACAPGATDTSQCIYGKKKFTEHLAKISFFLWRQYYKGTYHGTFSLAVEASPHCPKTLGFTGLENSSLGDQSDLRPVNDIYMYVQCAYSKKSIDLLDPRKPTQSLFMESYLKSYHPTILDGGRFSPKETI